jgi:RNA polymerase sigma-70 factor, ECF subfamily
VKISPVFFMPVYSRILFKFKRLRDWNGICTTLPGPSDTDRSKHTQLKSVSLHISENHSDEELVRLFTEKQDLEVLGVLYKRYMYLVYGVCMKYFKNREDSQDAVMQIFEVLVKDIPRFEIKNFKGWLYTVSRNHCLMQLRKTSKEKNRQPEISAAAFMESTVVMHPIEEESGADMQERLKICLDQLKEEQRLCVELFYYQQQCYKEIATGMNIGEEKVKSYIQNGKRNLKICLESKAELKNAD